MTVQKKVIIAISLCFLVWLGLNNSSRAAAKWPVKKGETLDWHYYYKDSFFANLSIGIKSQMEITNIEEDNITYTMQWEEVSVKADLNHSALMWLGFLSKDYKIEEGNTSQYTDIDSITWPHTFLNTPLVIITQEWSKWQEWLKNYSKLTEALIEDFLVPSLKLWGNENVTYSISGSSTASGYDITTEMNWITSSNETCYSRKHETCKYSNEGILKESFFSYMWKEASSSSETEEFIGRPARIPSYPIPFLLGFYLTTIFGLLTIIMQRISSRRVVS